MVGYNFRLGEIESAIGIQQIKKLNDIINKRQNLADKLIDGISKLPGLQVPYVQDECSHVYYVFPIQVDSKVTKIHRDKIFSALTAEGLSIGKSYGNLHLLPMFQNKIAYGSSGFPWSSDICKRDVDYSKGICPVSEELNEKRYIGLDFCQYDYTESDIQLIVNTFHKVWNNLDKLK